MHEQEKPEEEYYEQGSILAKDFQINDLLTSINHKAAKMKLLVPVFKEQEGCVVLTDTEGKPKTNEHGEYLYKRQKIKVFQDWKIKKHDIPAPEIFTRDLIYANLTEKDRDHLSKIHRLYCQLCMEMVRKKEDYSEIVWFLAQRAATIIETSRALHGNAALLAKSNFSHQHASQSFKQRLEQDKKEGFLKRLLEKKEKNDNTGRYRSPEQQFSQYD